MIYPLVLLREHGIKLSQDGTTTLKKSHFLEYEKKCERIR